MAEKVTLRYAPDYRGVIDGKVTKSKAETDALLRETLRQAKQEPGKAA